MDEIELPIAALASPQTAIRYLLQHLADQGQLDPQTVPALFDAIMLREMLGSTAVGCGVAIPNARSPLLGDVLIVRGCGTRPIVWPAMNGETQGVTRVYLLLASAGTQLEPYYEPILREEGIV